MATKIRAGKWDLTVEQYGRRYVVRLANGMALTLGANKKCYDELIQKVSDGQMDGYIERHCGNGVKQEHSCETCGGDTDEPTVTCDNCELG